MVRRWTFREGDNGIEVCAGEHEKCENCEYSLIGHEETLRIIEFLRAEALSPINIIKYY